MPLDRASSPRLKPYKRSCQGEADASTPSHIMEPLCLLSTVAWAAYSRQASVSGQSGPNSLQSIPISTKTISIPILLLEWPFHRFFCLFQRQKDNVKRSGPPNFYVQYLFAFVLLSKSLATSHELFLSYHHSLIGLLIMCLGVRYAAAAAAGSTWTSTFHSLSLHRMTSIPDMHRGLHLNRISCEFGLANGHEIYLYHWF